MTQLPITREAYVCFRIDTGDINYPDEPHLFESTVIVDDPNDPDDELLIASYAGEKSLDKIIPYEEYFDLLFREDFKEVAKAHIKQSQIQELEKLEGTGGASQRKAIEKIATDATFSYYDELIKKKAYVRNFGNSEEERLDDLTPEELIGYYIVFDFDNCPDIIIRRLTVGSFEQRFTPDEQERIEAGRAASPALARNYNAMISRTHIYLDSPELRPVLLGMAAGGLLDAEPSSDDYASRVDELLRDGRNDEQYRVISYV